MIDEVGEDNLHYSGTMGVLYMIVPRSRRWMSDQIKNAHGAGVM